MQNVPHQSAPVKSTPMVIELPFVRDRPGLPPWKSLNRGERQRAYAVNARQIRAKRMALQWAMQECKDTHPNGYDPEDWGL
jgi:hypothetical protein